MTREEAIVVIKTFMGNPLFSDKHKQAFHIAIHDIDCMEKWNDTKRYDENTITSFCILRGVKNE